MSAAAGWAAQVLLSGGGLKWRSRWSSLDFGWPDLSWWRVSLPLWAVLGHNILYIIIGFVWLSLADDSAAITIRPGDGGYGYQIAALVCFVVFADNLLRRIEGPGENMLWVSSGRWELIVVSGTLSVLMQLLFWAEVVDPGTRRSHRG